MFTEIFGDFVVAGGAIRCELPGGHYATATIKYDPDAEAPWNDAGHGQVRDVAADYSRPRGKKPGEIVLGGGGRGHFWLYDFAEACKTARLDGWGYHGKSVEEHRAAGLTLRQIAANAARDDADALAAWLNGDWYFVGVVVQIFDANGHEVGDDCSLWRIECNYPAPHKPRGQVNDYLTEVANELLADAIDELRGRGLDLDPPPGTPPRVYAMTDWS